ncbi:MULTISPECIES: sensor histidine kinase [unclassified Gilliamella]|uniref:sensor histidine kinase n=1 Tax=unclassified Gilliamella TaxID=2685620 RepID=UPI002269ADF7|nr:MULTISPECIES: sensor histidine kinase [unclassified Gilliamella]MCX8641639.1 sensor histidine kinase [Gilliamella sp. B3835]MCX8706854.1 sensor histidine kinase [Gilliamella sp. B3783]MCX8708712.1 sensor histidine kinase [Gilliamella sp. B3780]MCX8713756.1 sensor histidine kinase [Gilliamella sp. B3781]MCX8715542.1 sensor histidine kinase [Gilliamella sp. B3784]
MFEFDLVLQLLQQMCIYLVIAYLLSKTPIVIPLMQVTVHLPHKLVCYCIFSLFCIMGSYFGLHIEDTIANTRAIGAILGGLLGGPMVGLLVGITGGIHRYTLGGITAESCMLSTILTGLISGLLHYGLMKKGRVDLIYNPLLVGVLGLLVESLEMIMVLLISRPFDVVLHAVKSIAAPMIVANSIGAAMFMRILLDRRAIFERYTSAFSAKALKIAASTEGLLRDGFNQSNSTKVAQIIYQELDIGAVSITDREKILAFIGVGDDHHLPGTPITSNITLEAIEQNDVKYLDGVHQPYQCSINKYCRLGSTLVIPLRGENNTVVGTIKLYEAKNTLFSSINRTLGEGIASLLSAQILAGQNEHYKQLLSKTEIKLLHAQVNPHFLFNALNTLLAVIRRDKQQASQLVQNLSTFFRKNLKRTDEIVTLKDEIEHVNAYLQIEKMRFMEQLTVEIAIPPHLESAQLPAFSLQPIVENAIKHGTSQLIGKGKVAIYAYEQNQTLVLEVMDNAGNYCENKKDTKGLGLNLVDKRINIRYGEQYGIKIECEPDTYTKVVLTLPLQKESCIQC